MTIIDTKNKFLTKRGCNDGGLTFDQNKEKKKEKKEIWEDNH